MLIDDFTTGLYTSPPMGMGTAESYQPISTNPAFPVRSTLLYVPGPPSSHHHHVMLHVGSDERLSLSTGPRQFHRLEVSYGFNLDGSINPLKQNLREFTGFRVNFDFNDLQLNFNIRYWSRSWSVNAQMGHNVPASFTPFSIDFPFAGFAGAATPDDVEIINLIFQTGNGSQDGGGNDYKIVSFEAY
jgi:hypothetical protein